KVDSNGCADTTCQLGVGIDAPQPPKGEWVELYPNPNNGSFTIHLTHPIAIGFVSEEVTIEVYDVFGKQIHYKKTNASTEIQLDLGNVPKGLYFVSITTKKQKEIRKIVIE
ncbi:MAG: T9SS type A sorting domain-containing protein, partial [Vicingaceae bacterium]|nr:T9SS type A sorting domain-containing protein [Vicingaceae bacterium]